MLQRTVVELKSNWTIACEDAAQYEKLKTILFALGYSFQADDRYEPSYAFVCSSDWVEGGVTQSLKQELNHFENIMDFLVFHAEAHEQVAVVLEGRREELKKLDAALVALQ